MSKFKPYLDINIDPTIPPEEREALAYEIIDYIIDRTKKGKDKNGKSLPSYSKSYIDSDNFKAFGKSAKRVDSTLSGEMLDAMDLISHSIGSLRIGYDESDTDLIGKVEGNVLGTYGNKSAIPGKQRDFFGISKEEVKELEANYVQSSQSEFAIAVNDDSFFGSTKSDSFASNVRKLNQQVDTDFFDILTKFNSGGYDGN